MAKFEPRLVKAFGIGNATGAVLGGLVVGIIALVGVHMASFSPPVPAPAKTGEYVVVLVDDDQPTIAEGQILDGPTLRPLKAQKRAIVRSDAWKLLGAKGYDKLIAKAGSLPMVAVLNAEGAAAYIGKLPMEEDELQKICLKYVTGLPPPASGSLSTIVPLDAGAPNLVSGDSIIVNGKRMMLTARPGTLKALAKYGDSHPSFPPASWTPVDRRPIFGSADWIFDQGQHGSCVGHGGVSALEKVRWLCGMGYTKLSPTCLYGQINGNRDEGAVISDIVPALQNTGVTRFSLIGENLIYTRQFPAGWKKEAARYKLGEAYSVDNWNELISALETRRYIAVFGVQVGNTWTHFDRFGVAGHDVGPGNHCLHADGVRRTGDGRVVLDVPNSWGYEFGPFKNGRVFLDERHLFANGCQASVVVIRVAQDDPQDADGPPAYKG